MHYGRFEKVWLMSSVLLIACASAIAAPGPQRATVLPGIDVALTDSIALFRGKHTGFVTNVAAVDAKGVSAIARLRAGGVQIVALFAPEHGLTESAAPEP